MKKKWLCFSLLAVLLVACAKQTVKPTEKREANLSTLYKDLPKDNQFEQMEKKDVLNFLEHGTGVLTLGFPECKWCQAYYPYFNDVLKDASLKTKYFNIYEQKKADRSFYDQLASTLEKVNTTGKKIVRYDNEGKQVIYVPLVLFVEHGKIVGFDNETSDISGMETKDYWTSEKKDALKQRLTKFVKQNKQAQEKNQDGGCNSDNPACKVG
ncbi:hypothetical protein [Bulleidia sp. zg-1006]|uniref:hypothetical protein n=1 Tax=Bulleidia sp. zg-1006 TaxID=2806552 RepID=UPI00193A7233|nr:hypothetical protein [Bulleidia sp. zg-1006]QRG86901.1 hypothetical protein JOS54_00870 [Bulleidia sp. zg-1006]